MKKIFLIIAVIILCGLFFLLLTRTKNSNLSNMPQVTNIPEKPSVVINNIKIIVRLAKTPEEQSRGLSGTASLSENEGMLFIFPVKNRQTFWMKDMLIPLDMIWISDDKIVDISKNIPIPKPGMSDIQLPIYSPKEEVNYVLEVNAGYSDINNIKIGDRVEFNYIY